MMLMFRKHLNSTVQLCIYVLFLYNFAYVQATIQCASTQAEWNKASASLQCQEPNYYHCLRNENGILTQQCLQRVWIQSGMCPEFNSRVGKIDVFKCQSDENNCPNTIFWSNAVYTYPTCYDKTSSYAIIPTTLSSATSPNTTLSGSINQEMDFKVILAIVIAIVVFALIVTTYIVVVYLRRKNSRGNERVEELRNEIPRDTISQTRQSEHSRDINEEEKLIGSTTEFEKEKKEVHILILLCVRNAVLDENIVKKEAMEYLKVAVDLKNSFRKWANNKSEESYVFQDWIQPDEEFIEGDFRKTHKEIIQAIKKNRTKFVFVLPLKVWTENEILKEMENWTNCKKKTILSN